MRLLPEGCSAFTVRATGQQTFEGRNGPEDPVGNDEDLRASDKDPESRPL